MTLVCSKSPMNEYNEGLFCSIQSAAKTRQVQWLFAREMQKQYRRSSNKMIANVILVILVLAQYLR